MPILRVGYVRHARVVKRPATFERPKKRGIHEPADDVRFGTIYTIAPLECVWNYVGALLWG